MALAENRASNGTVNRAESSLIIRTSIVEATLIKKRPFISDVDIIAGRRDVK